MKLRFEDNGSASFQNIQGCSVVEIGGGAKPNLFLKKNAASYVNLDSRNIPEVDCVMDVASDPFPNDTNSVDLIYTSNALNKVGDLIRVFNECWRVLKWGGSLMIKVPHRGSPSAVADPTIRRVFVEESFDLFCGDKLLHYKLDYGIRCAFEMEGMFVLGVIGEASCAVCTILTKDRDHYELFAPYFEEIENKEASVKDRSVEKDNTSGRTRAEQLALDTLLARHKIGRTRYGRGLSHTINEPEQWIDHAIAEAADLFSYLTAMKLRMEDNKAPRVDRDPWELS